MVAWTTEPSYRWISQRPPTMLIIAEDRPNLAPTFHGIFICIMEIARLAATNRYVSAGPDNLKDIPKVFRPMSLSWTRRLR